MAEQIIVDEKLFLGRVEEQKQFRAALSEVTNSVTTDELPYISLLFGDGGMGKTTLAKRFRDIAEKDPEFAAKVQVLWIDWEDERKKFASLQVGREQITAESVFKVIHAASIRNKWGRQFAAYRKAISESDEAERQVAEIITSDDTAEELALLRSSSSSAANSSSLRAGVLQPQTTGRI